MAVGLLFVRLAAVGESQKHRLRNEIIETGFRHQSRRAGGSGANPAAILPGCFSSSSTGALAPARRAEMAKGAWSCLPVCARRRLHRQAQQRSPTSRRGDERGLWVGPYRKEYKIQPRLATAGGPRGEDQRERCASTFWPVTTRPRRKFSACFAPFDVNISGKPFAAGKTIPCDGELGAGTTGCARPIRRGAVG